jgi:hypothetical protein
MIEEPTLNEQVEQAVLWTAYESALRLKNRFVPRDPKYVDDLCQACLDCRSELVAGTVLYRARINPPGDEQVALPISKMRQPPPEKALDGRINPVGVPCLYAALDPDTAVAEVRPWTLALLTVATFTTPRSIDVVDLRQASGGQRRPAAYWAAHMIQRPVHEKDPLAYIGTQFLAERLKAAGAGGLLYDSALGPHDKTTGTPGTNVALFSSDDLQDGKTVLWLVLDVKYTAVPRPD